MAQTQTNGNQNGRSEENLNGKSFEDIKIPVPHGHISGKYYDLWT